jgi:hypothetical protein
MGNTSSTMGNTSSTNTSSTMNQGSSTTATSTATSTTNTSSTGNTSSTNTSGTIMGETFDTILLGKNEVPVVAPERVTGESGVWFWRDSQQDIRDFNYWLFAWSGSEKITDAHLHCGVPGQNGPIVVSLFHNASGTTVNGQLSRAYVSSTDIESTGENCMNTIGYPIRNLKDLAKAIEEGKIYANVHSLNFPSGVARGQLPMGMSTSTPTSTTPNPTSTNPMPTSTTTSTMNGNITIDVVKHLCASGVTNASDAGNCPIVLRTGDMPMSGATSSGSFDFNFVVRARNAQGVTETLAATSTLMNSQNCSSATSTMSTSSSTATSTNNCVDQSFYEWRNLPRTDVTLTEQMSAGSGMRFGFARLDSSDQNALISAGDGIINLNTRDDADGRITIHVYNFR